MTEGVNEQKARELMETVSFELETDLRLHPQQLELGKAELLTDALTLPFIDIEKRLAQYVSGGSTAEKDSLRRSMKNYLARLNANPLVPLRFRLKVLERFENELELFDGEMTAAVLNAHKIGVMLVQQAARSDPAYLRVLVEMVANAIELAIRVLRFLLETYRPPAVIATRQVLDLSRLGLSVTPALKEDASAERDRLYKAISNFELLRKMDFFGKSHDEQQMIWNEMQHHVGVLKPRFCRKGDAPPDLGEDCCLLVTNMSRPNDPAKVMERLPKPLTYDCIVIPLDAFVDRLVTAINRVESIASSQELQRNSLITEESMRTTIAGGNAILDALHFKERRAKRLEQKDVRVIIERNLDKAFAEAHAAIVLNEYEYAPSKSADETMWTVLNMSNTGVCLERLGYEPWNISVGSMIGLSWIPHHGEPMLGFVRWLKEPKPGEKRMGIEFFKQHFRLYKAAMTGGIHAEETAKRSWPVLIRGGAARSIAIFPDTNIFTNLTFAVSHEGEAVHLKVNEILKHGPNYTICAIVRAKELDTSSSFDFSRS